MSRFILHEVAEATVRRLEGLSAQDIGKMVFPVRLRETLDGHQTSVELVLLQQDADWLEIGVSVWDDRWLTRMLPVKVTANVRIVPDPPSMQIRGPLMVEADSFE